MTPVEVLQGVTINAAKALGMQKTHGSLTVGKAADMAEKIAAGKLNKFFKENTLLPQAFVKDNTKNVGDYLKSVAAGLTVVSFKRLAVGA